MRANLSLDRVQKSGKNLGLQTEVTFWEKHMAKIHGDTWKLKRQMLDRFQWTNVLTLIFVCSMFCKCMQEITGFGMKNCSSFPAFA